VPMRFVEYFDDRAAEKNVSWWPHKTRDGDPLAGLLTDCATVVIAAAGQTQVNNLTHLKGKTVKITVNAGRQPDQVVDEFGVIALQYPARAGDVIEVGLPYTHTLETNPPEIPQASTIQGIPKRWAQLVLRVLDSCAANIQGTPVNFTKVGQALDQAPPLFTGDVTVTDFGTSRDGTVTISDDSPLPFTAVMLYGDLHVGDHA
jgi:hypothetical protein